MKMPIIEQRLIDILTREPDNMTIKCQGCNTPLDPVNAWMADGCPCNSPAGVNAGVLEDWRWFITQQNEQIKQAMATLAAAERDVSGFTKRAYANQNKIAELEAEVVRLRNLLQRAYEVMAAIHDALAKGGDV